MEPKEGGGLAPEALQALTGMLEDTTKLLTGEMTAAAYEEKVNQLPNRYPILLPICNSMLLLSSLAGLLGVAMIVVSGFGIMNPPLALCGLIVLAAAIISAIVSGVPAGIMFSKKLDHGTNTLIKSVAKADADDERSIKSIEMSEREQDEHEDRNETHGSPAGRGPVGF